MAITVRDISIPFHSIPFHSGAALPGETLLQDVILINETSAQEKTVLSNQS
jgi:hypothetical protein